MVCRPRTPAGWKRRLGGWGADPRDWRMSYEAVPLEQWVRIETWDGSTWSELKEFRFGDDVFEMAPADHEPDSNPE